MKKSIAIILLVMCSIRAQAIQVRHITSTNNYDLSVVRVAINEENKVYQFALCESITSKNCQLIGRAEGYSEQELISLRRTKRLAAFGVNVLDVSLVVTSLWAGAGLGGYIGAATVAGGFQQLGIGLVSGVVVGGAGGASAGGILISIVKFLNPTLKWREANTLAAQKLSQLKVNDVILDMDISDYAKNLAGVLGVPTL